MASCCETRGVLNRYALAALLASCATLATCSKDSSATPTPPPTPTRILRLGGNLRFGDVTVGTVRTDGILVISNDGNAVMTVTSLFAPSGSSGAFTATWTSGTISAGATQNVGIHFAPTSVRNYSGVITVEADQTSGTNTIAVIATGVSAAPAPPAPTPTPSPTPTPGPNGSTCSASTVPAGTTAVCNDGTYSQSQNRSGTCSSHGGVKCWICPGRLCNGLVSRLN